MKAKHQNHEFLQVSWTLKGLPQNSVTSIVQTPDGYLWLGTPAGLARFDGINFRNFTTANTPELKNNHISALVVDQQGTIWIGTETGEIIQYKNRNFIQIDDGQKINHAEISNFLVDKNGDLLVASHSGLQICRESCQKMDFNEPIEHLRKDSNDNLWLVSQKKLFRFQDGKFVRDENNLGEIVAFEPLPDGGFWVVKSNEFGLYQNGTYEILKQFGKTVWDVGTATSKDGKFWLDVNDKLYGVTKDKIEESVIEGVVGNTARCIFVDQDDDLWLGRQNDGLIQLLNWRVRLLRNERGNPINSVNSLAEDREGNVWIATELGLNIWKDGKLEQVSKNDSARGSLLIDSEGTLWSNTYGGLQSYRAGKFSFHQGINWDKTSIGGGLFEDRQKHLWVGCENCGVFVTDKQQVIAKYTVEDGLIDNSVNLIKETSDGAIWLATKKGVSCLKDGKFTNFTTLNGLSNNYVRDIYEDENKVIWFATFGGGVTRFNDGIFTSISSGQGLFDDFISRIISDEKDNLWFLGGHGVFLINRKILNGLNIGEPNQIYSQIQTSTDGKTNIEGRGGYQNAGIITSDGELWFPITNGLVVIDTKQNQLISNKPVIEDIVIENTLQKLPEILELNYDHEDLEIRFNEINLRHPEEVRFRYRMAGLDGDWEEAGNRRSAFYPRLPAGKYLFSVKATDPNGNWSQDVAQLEIIVYPPIYLTWWFMILMIAIGLLILMIIFRYRNWQFARQKAFMDEYAQRLLMAQEIERGRIAAEIHDNFGQQLLIIKNWAAYCLLKTPKNSKIREQISQIDEIAEQTLNDIRNMAKTLSPYHLEKAGFTNTAKFMVKQIAESSKIDFQTEIDQVDGILPKELEINLYRILQEIVTNIVKHSKATKAAVSLKLYNGLLNLTVRDNGIGFNQNELSDKEFGLGINGIKDRTKMLNGILTINSIIGQGTEIVVEVSLKKIK
ncbi:MAG TPA: two-component regulator propeller domain-containing protein [Pyrinomonadaceae bacterium]|nr:two-component regulator propeller domain-containing protein [Pyrinomonadaceae bacterium]